MDRLDEWRLFVAVATLRSFGAAAREKRKSPQAATRAIAALERRQGTRLFHRTTRSVTLTDDGARILERCQRALAAVDALEAPAAVGKLEGTVTVTAPILYGQMHVAPVVTAFLEAHPDVSVRLLLVDRVVSLADEGIDVAVRIGALPDSSLRAHVVGRVSTVTCAAKSYLRRAGAPRTPKALETHACIQFLPFGYPGVRIAVRPRLVVNTGQAAIDAARSGLGIVRLYSYQALEEKELVRVLGEFEPPSVPVQVVQLPGIRTRAASAFADFLGEALTTRRATRGASSSSRDRRSS